LKFIRNDISHAELNNKSEDEFRQMAEDVFEVNKIPISTYSSRDILEAIKDTIFLIRKEKSIT